MRSPAALVRLSIVLVLIALLSGILPNPAAAVEYTYLQVGLFDDRGQPIEGITFSLTADNGATIPQSDQPTSAYGFAEFLYVPTGSTITLTTAYHPPTGYELMVVGTETSGSTLADPALVMPFRYEPEASVRRTVTIEQRAIPVSTPTPTQVPPTATPVPPTTTPESTATATVSPTPVPTSTPTATPIPPTTTPEPTATLGPVVTPILTSTTTPEITPTVTPIPPTSFPAATANVLPPTTPIPTVIPIATSMPTELASTPAVTASPAAPSPVGSPAVAQPTVTATSPTVETPVATATTTVPPTSTPPLMTPTLPIVTATSTPPVLPALQTPLATPSPASPSATLTSSPTAAVTPEPTTVLTALPLATFAAPRVASVAVRYTDSAGMGLAGSWFQLDAADCQAPFQAARMTDATGSVRFSDVPRGTYCLVQPRAATGLVLMTPAQLVIDKDHVLITIIAAQQGGAEQEAPGPLSTHGPPRPEVRGLVAAAIRSPAAGVPSIVRTLPATGTGAGAAVSRLTLAASLTLSMAAGLLAFLLTGRQRNYCESRPGNLLD